MSNYLTIQEAARACRVSTKTIRRWVESGRLQASRDGQRLRFSRDDLAPFLGQLAGQSVDTGPDVPNVQGGLDNRDSALDMDPGQRVMLELVRELKSDAIAKAEAAAMWQARAEMLAGELADARGQVQQRDETIRALSAPREEPQEEAEHAFSTEDVFSGVAAPPQDPPPRRWWQRILFG